jgi:tRNA pseudouridine(38-40) synthase
VSAICQVVSTNFIPLEGIVEEVNGHLPDDIRILGYRRTVKGFDARKACDRRRYEYILPEWMFDPSLQPTSKEQTSGLSTEQFLARRNPDYVFDDADMAK